MTARARTSYPRLDAYVASLPGGWASYPTCEAESTTLAGLRERGAFEGLPSLPPELSRHLVDTTAPGWVPEIVHVAALLALRDARFGSEPDFLAWMDSLNAGLLQVALPSSVTTGEEAIRWSVEGWARFHRGSTLSIVSCETNHAVLTFAHPPFVFPETWMEVRRRTLAAVLVRAGAAQPFVRATPSDVGTTFDASWR